MQHMRIQGLLAAGAVFVSALSAAAYPTAAQRCEAGKIGKAGAYSNCLSKAEKALVIKKDAAKYDAAVAEKSLPR